MFPAVTGYSVSQRERYFQLLQASVHRVANASRCYRLVFDRVADEMFPAVTGQCFTEWQMFPAVTG